MINLHSFLTYAIVMSYTPGPNNIMSMANAGSVGFKNALPFNAGVIAGFLLITILSMLFGASLYALIPSFKYVMLMAGALYMLYLAYKMLRSTGGVFAVKTKGYTFFNGFILQFVNIKVLVYCITAVSTYILPYYNSFSAFIIFPLLLSIIGGSATLCWALFGSFFRNIFTKHARAANVIMALLLVYCAISLFF